MAHVMLFIAHAQTQYTLGTISSTLNGIADWQRGRGVPNTQFVTQNPQIKAMMSSLARAHATDAIEPVLTNAKAPVTIPLLRLLVSHLLHVKQTLCPISSFRAQQDTAFLLVGFFGFLRRSELAALRVRNVSLHPADAPSQSYITVFLRKSKTDQFGKGVHIFIHGTPNCGINVFQYIQEFLIARSVQGAGPNDFLFCSVSTRGISPGTQVSSGFLTDRLRALLGEIHTHFPHLHMNPTIFACHSLRRGGVVAAFEAGADVVLLKAHGRWRSDAILVYLSVSTTTRLSVTARI